MRRRRKKGQNDLQSQSAEAQATYSFPPRSSSLTEPADSPSMSRLDLDGLKEAMDSSSTDAVAADTEPGGEKAFSERKPEYEYSAEVLGLVDTSYEFPGTCVSLQVQLMSLAVHLLSYKHIAS